MTEKLHRYTACALAACVITGGFYGFMGADAFGQDGEVEVAPPAQPDAAPNPGIDTSPGLDVETATQVVSALRAAKYLVALGLVVLMLVAAFGRFAPNSWFNEQTKFWRTVIAGAIAAATVAATALAEGEPFSIDMLAAAALAAWSSAGMHRQIKNATHK